MPVGRLAVFAVRGQAHEATFQWMRNGVPLEDDPMFFQGSETCRLSIHNVASRFNNDLYAVRITNGEGEMVETDPARLNVCDFAVAIRSAAAIRFPAEIGASYQVEYSPSLDDEAWFSHGNPIEATEDLLLIELDELDPRGLHFRVNRVDPE